MMNAIKEEAKAIREKITGWRRDFHRHPELSFKEFETTKAIARILDEAGIHGYKIGVSGVPTGLVVDIKGQRGPGKCVALRADIDALPVQEENNVSYKSEADGIMHACGHDAHAAMLLGAALLLKKHEAEFSGTVRLIFQPSEEAGDGGAKPMIEEGVLDGVDNIAALHVWQPITSGKFAFAYGTTMASSDKFEVLVQGKGGHGAYPHQTIDPVLTAATIICQLQGIISREIDPLSTGVISACTIHSGTASNIIPETAKIEGTVRALTPEMREYLHSSIARVAKYTAEAHRCQASARALNGYPATVNDLDSLKQALRVVSDMMGPDDLIEVKSSMGAEDMGFFLEKIPGCYLYLGCAGEQNEFVYPHHNPKFDIDDSVLYLGTAFLTSYALDFLSGGNKE